MVRSILVGLLIISGASACKGGGSDAPAVVPGKAVGKVMEVSGKVTATRGSQTRDLDASSTVSGDDVITTAADGRITILLEHNNATWDLGPNKHEQVSTSMAWQLAKVDSPAGKVDETTTAAGRHAERAAANGESAAAPAASTERERASDEAPGGRPPAAEPAPAAQPSSGAPAPTSKGGAPARPRPVAAIQPPAKTTPPPPPPPSPKPTRETAAATEGDTGDPGATATAANTRSAVRVESPKAPDLDKRSDARGGGGNPLQTAVETERTALKACVVASGKPSFTIKVHVAKGVATITLADGSAADKACLAKVAARIKLTVDAADYSAIIAK